MDVAESKAKCTLYVGGLDEAVTATLLQAAFVPFGDLTDVQLPLEHATGKNRGFGFIEYATAEDAHDALENMHLSELMGRVIKVSNARPAKLRSQAVWADAEEWFEQLKASGGDDDAAPDAAAPLKQPASGARGSQTAVDSSGAP